MGPALSAAWSMRGGACWARVALLCGACPQAVEHAVELAAVLALRLDVVACFVRADGRPRRPAEDREGGGGLARVLALEGSPKASPGVPEEHSAVFEPWPEPGGCLVVELPLPGVQEEQPYHGR